MTSATEKPDRGSMPSTLDMVREAVDSFATDKSRSSVLAVDRQMMIDVGLILVDPERPVGDGLAMLDEELGEGAVSRSAFYRFAADFRDRFGAVESRHRERALRIAELAIDEATAGRQDNLATVLKTHLLRLAAERAVGAQDIEAIGGKNLGSILQLLDGHTQARVKTEELRIKQDDSERKAAKLEADLVTARERAEKLRLENERRQRELERHRQKEAEAVQAAGDAAKEGASGEEVVGKVREVLGLG